MWIGQDQETIVSGLVILEGHSLHSHGIPSYLWIETFFSSPVGAPCCPGFRRWHLNGRANIDIMSGEKMSEDGVL